MAKGSRKSPSAWAQLNGRWQITGSNATYIGPNDPSSPLGLCLSSLPLRSGTVGVQARLSEGAIAARIVIGRNAATGTYYSIGLGGYDSAYVLSLFTPGRGWQAQEVGGAQAQLSTNREYDIEVRILGQRVSLDVDGVRIFQVALPSPLQGDQVGLLHGATDKLCSTTFTRQQTSQMFLSSCSSANLMTAYTGK